MAKASCLGRPHQPDADEINIEPGASVVYVGTHGDRGALLVKKGTTMVLQRFIVAAGLLQR